MTTKPSMQSGAAVAEKAAAAGRGVKATEEQARAIICTAKIEGGGGGGSQQDQNQRGRRREIVVVVAEDTSSKAGRTRRRRLPQLVATSRPPPRLRLRHRRLTNRWPAAGRLGREQSSRHQVASRGSIVISFCFMSFCKQMHASCWVRCKCTHQRLNDMSQPEFRRN